MVPDPKTPILNCFYHLLGHCVLSVSEFSCLAMLAKPYPASGLAHMPQIPNELHFSQTIAPESLMLIWRPESCQLPLRIISYIHLRWNLCI